MLFLFVSAVVYAVGLLLICFSMSSNGSAHICDCFVPCYCRYFSAVTECRFDMSSIACNSSAIYGKLYDVCSVMMVVVSHINYCLMGPQRACLLSYYDAHHHGLYQ